METVAWTEFVVPGATFVLGVIVAESVRYLFRRMEKRGVELRTSKELEEYRSIQQSKASKGLVLHAEQRLALKNTDSIIHTILNDISELRVTMDRPTVQELNKFKLTLQDLNGHISELLMQAGAVDLVHTELLTLPLRSALIQLHTLIAEMDDWIYTHSSEKAGKALIIQKRIDLIVFEFDEFRKRTQVFLTSLG